MKRKICVVTGSRAEYGLLKWLMANIRDSGKLELQVIATGAHLAPAFGSTYQEIEADGFGIDRKVDLQLGDDTAVGITAAMGRGLAGFGQALDALAPDIVVVLGDRYEILAAVSAALLSNIPVAHIHGGEKTEGAVDDAIRHAITKMSHLHFVATEEHQGRVLQLGENPAQVFTVGGLGVDSIMHTQLLDKVDLERAIDFSFGSRNLMVTFHPETLSEIPPAAQTRALLEALSRYPDIHILFSMPNADAGGSEIARLIADYAAEHGNCSIRASLGQRNYLSCLHFMDGVVGNSSSGLLEAPSFRIGTVNIGDRQLGRVCADSVINCPAEAEAIASAIEKLYSADFRARLPGVKNPYGEGGAADKITAKLETISFEGLLRKSFVDKKCS